MIPAHYGEFALQISRVSQKIIFLTNYGAFVEQSYIAFNWVEMVVYNKYFSYEKNDQRGCERLYSKGKCQR